MATREQADRTLAMHADAILENPNVSSVSVIEDARGDSIIEIGLIAAEGATGPGAVAPAPDELIIPDAAGNLGRPAETIKVRKRIVGRIEIHSYKDRDRPAKGGASCGLAKGRGAGTLGARVTSQGKPCILSNWHVLYGKAGGANGDAVIQPGYRDGGREPNDTVGDNLVGVLSDQLDAALAEIRDPADDYVTAGTFAYGAIVGVGAAAANMAVKKCGRTTGTTNGTVTSTNATVKVGGYSEGTRTFKNQIQTTAMSEKGDSGSIVLDDKNNAVGLLFAGGKTDSYANRIDLVIDALKLRFD